MRWFIVGLAITVVTSCGEEETPDDRQNVELLFEYRASTERDPTIGDREPGCVATVGPTHFHGSWDGGARRELDAIGTELWTNLVVLPALTREYTTRFDDPNNCDRHPFGTVSRRIIFVNGLRLTKETIMDSFNGPRPAFMFRVNGDGSIDTDF